MFAITTDHASDPELARHSAGWMTWTSHAVYLAWLGFSDVHSGIDHYMVTVGSTYMGKDLSKVRLVHLSINNCSGYIIGFFSIFWLNNFYDGNAMT